MKLNRYLVIALVLFAAAAVPATTGKAPAVVSITVSMILSRSSSVNTGLSSIRSQAL